MTYQIKNFKSEKLDVRGDKVSQCISFSIQIDRKLGQNILRIFSKQTRKKKFVFLSLEFFYFFFS